MLLESSSYLVKIGFSVTAEVVGTILCLQVEYLMLGLTGGEVYVFISCAFKFDLGIKHNVGNSNCGVCPRKPTWVYRCRKQCVRKSRAKYGCFQFVRLPGGLGPGTEGQNHYQLLRA